MSVDRFRVATISRASLIALTLSLFAYFLFHSRLYEMAALMALSSAFELFELVRWIEKRNQNVARFLEAVEADDFTQTFSASRKSKAFNELNKTLNRITRRFELMRAESESQFQYFQFVVQQLTVGLIVFQRGGKIDLMNAAAKKLLGVTQLRSLKDVRSLSEELFDALSTNNYRTRSLVRIDSDNTTARLAVQTSEFRMRGVNYTLASLQDMRGELEEVELDAWQNLIRVLTHEIANSIAPIASLASTASRLLSDSHSGSGGNGTPVNTALKDVETAIRTIEGRSEGLLRFVNSYRTLTHIPNPRLKIFPVAMLFSRAEQLVKSSIQANGIKFNVMVQPESLELTADPDLLEQVLLNLLVNSVQALEGKPDGEITLSAQLEERGRMTIRVEDNGPGIPKDMQEKIFIPFFTTKDSGSGIGLSLSRQILHLHRAMITVRSQPGEHTVFTIVF